MKKLRFELKNSIIVVFPELQAEYYISLLNKLGVF